MTGRRGRRRKQLLDDLKEKRRYWKLKEEALDINLENSIWKRLRTCRKTDYRKMRPTICREMIYLKFICLDLMHLRVLCFILRAFSGKNNYLSFDLRFTDTGLKLDRHKPRVKSFSNSQCVHTEISNLWLQSTHPIQATACMDIGPSIKAENRAMGPVVVSSTPL
jgi:hypothetical protein